jgi:hypothetical protein
VVTGREGGREGRKGGEGGRLGVGRMVFGKGRKEGGGVGQGWGEGPGGLFHVGAKSGQVLERPTLSKVLV